MFPFPGKSVYGTGWVLGRRARRIDHALFPEIGLLSSPQHWQGVESQATWDSLRGRELSRRACGWLPDDGEVSLWQWPQPQLADFRMD